MQVLIPLCLLRQQSFLSSKASIAHTTPGIWTGHLHWEGIASEQEDTQPWREQQYTLQERTFLWCDRRLRPTQAIKQAGSTSWLCVLLPPRSQNCSAHIWNLSQAQNGLRQRPGWRPTARLPKSVRHDDLWRNAQLVLAFRVFSSPPPMSFGPQGRCDTTGMSRRVDTRTPLLPLIVPPQLLRKHFLPFLPPSSSSRY